MGRSVCCLLHKTATLQLLLLLLLLKKRSVRLGVNVTLRKSHFTKNVQYFKMCVCWGHIYAK